MALTTEQINFIDEHKVDAVRFWSKVDKTVDESSCWEWQGAKDHRGYGRFHVGKSRNASMLAHRISYGLETGLQPEAVCHRCDNPSCCNPVHLFGGTKADNNRDMVSKGRHASKTRKVNYVKGNQHPAAKLTEEMIPLIKKEYASGEYSQRKLAEKYGVSQRTIVTVIHEVGWKHV